MARVCMCLTSNQRRGAELFGYTLAGFLGEEHEVDLVALTAGGGEANLDVEVLGTSRTDPRLWRRLHARARRADVVFGIGSSTLLIGSVVSAAARRPFVYRSIGDPTYWGAVRLAQWRIGAPLRSAAAIGALFPDAARYFVDRYRVEGARIAVIPSAVDSAAFPPRTDGERGAVRAEFELDPEDQILLYVGALSEEKNPQAALATIERLGGSWRLWVVGDGPLRAELEAMGAGRATFFGMRTDVARFLAAADVLIAPSKTEGIPRGVIEAQMRGVAVVGTDVGGLGYVVADRQTGRVVSDDSAESLSEAVEEAYGSRGAYGHAGEERSRDLFAMANVAARWSQVLVAAASGSAIPNAFAADGAEPDSDDASRAQPNG